MPDAKNHIVDRSRIVVPQGTMEDFKRPDHADFKTSAELKADGYTGLRRNAIAATSEIWMLGDLVVSISDAELIRNPQAVNIAMQDIFQLDRVMPDTDEVLEYDGVKR